MTTPTLRSGSIYFFLLDRAWASALPATVLAASPNLLSRRMRLAVLATGVLVCFLLLILLLALRGLSERTLTSDKRAFRKRSLERLLGLDTDRLTNRDADTASCHFCIPLQATLTHTRRQIARLQSGNATRTLRKFRLKNIHREVGALSRRNFPRWRGFSFSVASFGCGTARSSAGESTM